MRKGFAKNNKKSMATNQMNKLLNTVETSSRREELLDSSAQKLRIKGTYKLRLAIKVRGPMILKIKLNSPNAS